MCGIFGAVYGRDQRLSAGFAARVVRALLKSSESRGNEAAGLLLHTGSSIELVKQAGSVAEFLANPRFQTLLAEAETAFARVQAGEPGAIVATLGHSRMVTNGFQSDNDNNQPVVVEGAVGIHNGIIVNDEALWQAHPELTRHFSVDTEVLLQLARAHTRQAGDPALGLRRTFDEIYGSASTAIFFDDLLKLVLATNTGSLFTLSNAERSFFAFASERYIVQSLLTGEGLERELGPFELKQVKARTGLLVDLATRAQTPFELGPGAKPPVAAPAAPALPVADARREPRHAPQAPSPHAAPAHAGAHAHNGRLAIIDRSHNRRNLRRCTRCILPASYPFMEFDAEGVCNYCRRWKRIAVKGEEALRAAVEPYRSKDGSPDVIVAFSGGRDSSYGLHYVKKVLGMNPVAFTFDWGMVTDLARRNQARICGSLGVEHILRSADLTTKRRYVRKNVEAWLKRPELGMVTLFTAGDKEFYHYARQLRRETGIKLVIFCTGNMIEDTPYKTGLCGIREDDHGMTLTGLSFRNEMALLWYYMRNYLANPAYFNSSLWDTLKAYWYTFVVKDDFLYLFHYLPWREEEIVGTIRREYDWEIATDTSTTWRIGDGTAPFYNYIYDTIAGFSEDEVMLSNMIREGHLERDEALRRAAEYSRPRFPSLREYAQMVGFNCEEALRVINGAPKQFSAG